MTRTVRRGLPRVPGGEPWPPASSSLSAVAAAPDPGAGAPDPAPTAPGEPSGETLAETPAGTVTAAPATSSPAGTVPLRRGLPRIAGGEPWPPPGLAPASAAPPAAPSAVPSSPEPVAVVEPVAREAAAPQDSAPQDPAQHASAPHPPEIPGADRPERRPLPPWAARAVRPVLAALAVLVVAVIVARWMVTLAPVEEFLATHPGTEPLPADAPVGIPAWLAWQHFFNAFLLVLIVRTGLQVRRERRPAAYWAPRGNPAAKIGLTSWTHQALDVLWVANGIVYLVMLFVTGQWVRIVPTSWSVFPEAVSAALQYLSLDWPTEDGWVHYNALQQLTYFVTVFVAAPLAVATGVRMSRHWRSQPVLDRLAPLPLARRLHFPVMLYFVAFVVTHVGLVLATGARTNLNHMFAGRDDTSWIGLGVFALSLVVIVGAAVALRPVLVAPVAGRFGTVSTR